jgi:hypothetical protein
MEALSTRGHNVVGGDYNLTPLSVKGSQAALLAELVQSSLADEVELVDVYREADEGQVPPLIAQGYEITRSQAVTVADTLVERTERVLVVYTPTLAQSAYRGLQGRILQLLDLPTSIYTNVAANSLPNPP